VHKREGCGLKYRGFMTGGREGMEKKIPAFKGGHIRENYVDFLG